MKSPVYRNLDKPFQVFGFNTVELIILCIFFVGGSEVAQAFAIERIWPFLFTIVLGLGILWTRRSLGDFFVRRLFRFCKLPRELYSRILILRRHD